MRISNNNKISYSGNLTKFAQPLRPFLDKNSVLPTLLIETGVTLGRTYEASKKGGKKEAIERFVEQGTSAVIWLWGVQAINKIISASAELFKKGISQNENFKGGNMLASLALATGFIGFVLPKINHFISSKLTKKTSRQDTQKQDTLIKTKSLEEFKNKNKNPSFCANINLAGIAKTFETNNALRLLVTDTGVILGRYKNGRNKYEKIEGLFRDIASIYFYLGATKNFVDLARKITKTDKIGLNQLDNLIKNPKIATAKDNSTIRKNFAFYAMGTALSAFALGILIPKAQYALRKKLTNKDQFPGDDNYKVEDKKA